MTSASRKVPTSVGNLSIPDASAEWFKHGWMPFPVRASDKQPLIKWRTDPSALPESPAEAKALFEHMVSRHGVVMIGIALPHSVVVLDIDHRPEKGWDASCIRDELARTFDIDNETPEALTPSGGRHLWLELPPGAEARNWTSAHKRFPIDGIDIRTDGGFIIVPPSERGDGRQYTWLPHLDGKDAASVQLASPALVAALAPPIIDFNARAEGTVPRDSEQLMAYAFAAYRDEVAAVRLCSKGGRNSQLFKSAAALGSLVEIGVLTEGHVTRTLEDAAKACGLVSDDGLQATLATIASGLKAGRQKPRTFRGMQS
jgi:putative DNA primase/helicase